MQLRYAIGCKSIMNAMPADLMPRHRLTVQDYYRMSEVGLLAPDARVELIGGEIIDIAPIGPRHSEITRRLDARLHQAADRHVMVSVQMPLTSRFDVRAAARLCAAEMAR